jgi:hypothetical protein
LKKYIEKILKKMIEKITRSLERVPVSVLAQAGPI